MKSIRNKRVLLVLMLTIVLMVAMSSFAFAEGVNPGVELGTWITTNVKGLFVGVLAFIGIIALVKRSLMTAVMMFVFAGIGAAFIYGGETLGKNLGDLINSFF